jgi:hypothetical protein
MKSILALQTIVVCSLPKNKKSVWPATPGSWKLTFQVWTYIAPTVIFKSPQSPQGNPSALMPNSVEIDATV